MLEFVVVLAVKWTNLHKYINKSCVNLEARPDVSDLDNKQMSLQGMIKLKCAATNSSEIKRATRLTWGSQETRKHRKQEFLSINLRWWGSQWVRSRSRMSIRTTWESLLTSFKPPHKERRHTMTGWEGSCFHSSIRSPSAPPADLDPLQSVQRDFVLLQVQDLEGTKDRTCDPTSQEVPDGARSETALDF